jgi:homoserine trans-succinylase
VALLWEDVAEAATKRLIPIASRADLRMRTGHADQSPHPWRGHAHLLFANWINPIYQTTPFDLGALGDRSIDVV